MSDGPLTRTPRRSRPVLEGLESRALLSTATADMSGISALANPPLKRFQYVTPQGARVSIVLHGAGTLEGTNVDAQGALDLEFSGTNEATRIDSKVVGGGGYAPLRLLKHKNLPADSISGTGSSLVYAVNLKDFDLIPGGKINLTGGVQNLFLDSVAPNSQINAREIPASLLAGTSTTSTENGVTLGFLIDQAGARTLSNAGGTFSPTLNLVPSVGTSATTGVAPGAPDAPPGVVISIKRVNGPSRSQVGVGDPQIFGYDSTTNSLVRYDLVTDPTTNAITGSPSLTIPNALPGGPIAEPGVSLARNNGQLIVLISNGDDAYAYNPLTGASVGSFSLANIKTATFNPYRLGNVDSFTIVGDPNGGPNGLGRIEALNVTQSLLTGQASVIPNALPYDSKREFGFSGGFTSIAGSSTLFAAGGAHFDPYQPNAFQRGVASLSPGSKAGVPSFSETARNALTRSGATTNSGPHGEVGTNPSNALGSVDLGLALVTNFDPATQTNTVSLYNPQTFARATDVTLAGTPSRLTGITQSFHPAIAGVALVDVQGNTQSFRANTARGLVFNGLGNVNLVKIQSSIDTTIVGYPITHIEMPRRQNVSIISSTRNVGDRNGVTEITNLRPTGPLTLP